MLDSVISQPELETHLLERYYSTDGSDEGDYLGELNFFITFQDDPDYLEKSHFMEALALGKDIKEQDEEEINDTDGPKMMQNLTDEAKEMREKLESARKAKDPDLLGSLIFDAECDEMGEMIDLQWYEQY